MASIVKSLRILGDTNRLRMVLLLAREELSVAELQEILGMGQSTISTHLAQLKHAGLVEDRRTGKNIWYRFKQESGFRVCYPVAAGPGGDSGREARPGGAGACPAQTAGQDTRIFR